MSDEEDEDTPSPYEVGYKRPPKSGQFKKGEPSRNPKGRPRTKRKSPPPLPNAVRLAERILSASRRPVKVRENGEVEEIPTIDAMMRSLAAKGLQGNTRAQIAYVQLTDRAESTIVKDWNENVEGVRQMKAHWQEVFEDCDRRRVPRPEPVPHPDEIILDFDAMEVRYNGPTSEAQAKRWEAQRERVRRSQEGIREYRADLRTEPAETRRLLEEEIAWEMAIITRIDSMLPSKETRRAPGFDLRRWRAEHDVDGIGQRELMERHLRKLRVTTTRT